MSQSNETKRSALKHNTPKQTSIRLKLLSATIVAGLLALLIAAGGLRCMHLMNQRLKEVVDVAAEKVKLTNLLRQDFYSVTRSERNMLLSSDEEEFDRLATTMDTIFISIDSHVSQLRDVIEVENEDQLDSFIAKFAEWKTNHEKVRLYSDLDSQRQARELSLGDGEKSFDEFELLLNQMVYSISNPGNEPVAAARTRDVQTTQTDLSLPNETKTSAQEALEEGPDDNNSEGPEEGASVDPATEKDGGASGQSNGLLENDSSSEEPAALRHGPFVATQEDTDESDASDAIAQSEASDGNGKTDETAETGKREEADGGQPVTPTEDRTVDPETKLRMLATLLRDSLKFQRAEKNLVLKAHVDTEEPDQQLVNYKQLILDRLLELREALNDDELVVLDVAEGKLNEYFQTNEKIQKVVERKGGLYSSEFKRLRGTPLAKDCERYVNQLAFHSEVSMDNYEQESSSLYKSFRSSLLFLSFIAVASGVVISLFVGGNVARNIGKLSDYAKQIHLAKDLTRPVPNVSNDEIGELATAFDEMRESLLKQNNRLANLNETLEHKSDEMEQFVYSVSHDLKSPLVSCKGLVGLINEDIAEGEIEEALRSAARLSSVTDQMGETIDDLLTFSRLGRNEVHVQTVDVDQLVHAIGDEWQERFESDGVDFTIYSPLPAIQSDSISVRRVFENLIGNALKYAGESVDAMVEVGGERRANSVAYFVRDNGPGIDPQYHEKIFGLFQRLDTSKNGSGIGLASAAKIIRHSRGRIWVESELGYGATFWIEFPD